MVEKKPKIREVTFKKGTRGKISPYSIKERHEFGRRAHENEISQADLAAELGITRQGVALWVKSYREQVLGLKLKKPKHVKKKRFPTADEKHRFQWELRSRRPSQLGIGGGPDDIWTEESVGSYFTRELGPKYGLRVIWRFMEHYLIDAEPDEWAMRDREAWEKKGNAGPPPRERPVAFEDLPKGDRSADGEDAGDDLGVKKRKRGRPRKGEEVQRVQTLTADDVELMEKEIAEVRATMIKNYQEQAGIGMDGGTGVMPKPGQRVGKRRQATKSRHTKPRKKKKKR